MFGQNMVDSLSSENLTYFSVYYEDIFVCNCEVKNILDAFKITFLWLLDYVL